MTTDLTNLNFGGSMIGDSLCLDAQEEILGDEYESFLDELYAPSAEKAERDVDFNMDRLFEARGE